MSGLRRRRRRRAGRRAGGLRERASRSGARRAGGDLALLEEEAEQREERVPARRDERRASDSVFSVQWARRGTAQVNSTEEKRTEQNADDT